jgi:hypothetical protein
MASTQELFNTLSIEIPKINIIRQLRKTFAEVISKNDIAVQKLIQALNEGKCLNDEIEKYGMEGYYADDKIRQVLMEWWLRGDCNAPLL